MNEAQVTPPDPRRRALRMAAVLALVLVAGVAGVLLARTRHEPAALPPPPPPFLPAPSAPAAPPATATAPVPPPTTRTPAATVPASVDRPDGTSRPASAPRSRPPSARPPRPALTGTYRVVDSFDDGFIGEVLIANPTGQDRDWTVRLRFPDNVGELRTSWVESAPQATLRTEGDTFVWRSGVPAPAGGRVALRFHFARSGAGDRPVSCTVDGAACTG
jgi:hypothetical protein